MSCLFLCYFGDFDFYGGSDGDVWVVGVGGCELGSVGGSWGDCEFDSFGEDGERFLGAHCCFEEGECQLVCDGVGGRPLLFFGELGGVCDGAVAGVVYSVGLLGCYCDGGCACGEFDGVGSACGDLAGC